MYKPKNYTATYHYHVSAGLARYLVAQPSTAYVGAIEAMPKRLKGKVTACTYPRARFVIIKEAI